jgi:thiol peroxidase
MFFLFALLGLTIGLGESSHAAGNDNQPTLTVGDRLPDATLIGFHGKSVRLTDTQSRVKLISIVPQLNTPVCDEQTHHFSEQNAGLDRTVEIITLSTNPSDDQAAFAKKAGISNITFLSDAPSFEFVLSLWGRGILNFKFNVKIFVRGPEFKYFGGDFI